jgi:hypothetical protein
MSACDCNTEYVCTKLDKVRPWRQLVIDTEINFVQEMMKGRLWLQLVIVTEELQGCRHQSLECKGACSWKFSKYAVFYNARVLCNCTLPSMRWKNHRGPHMVLFCASDCALPLNPFCLCAAEGTPFRRQLNVYPPPKHTHITSLRVRVFSTQAPICAPLLPALPLLRHPRQRHHGKSQHRPLRWRLGSASVVLL